MRALITAGATRNPIDAVRYISAHSSGRTGVVLACSLRDAGVEPWLLGSAEARLRAPELPGEEYRSTRELMGIMEAWVRANPGGAVLHACAVGDYEVDTQSSKVPSGQPEWTLRLTPTPKIADHVRGWGLTGPYVTFKAASPETTLPELEAIAQRQRQRTGSDLVFANVLGRLGVDVLLVGEQTRHFSERTPAVEALVEWVVQRS